MSYQRFKKYVKRTTRKVARVARRRYAPKGKVNYNKIVKDVKFLKAVLNPEQKRHHFQIASVSQVGQCTSNVSGQTLDANYYTDIVPYITQGTSYSTRNGSSIKLNTLDMKFQFYQQANTFTQVRLKLMLVRPKIFVATTSPFPNFLEPAPLTGLRDFHARRNWDHTQDFKVLMTKYITVPGGATANQVIVKDYNLFFRFKNTHIKYDGSTTTVDSPNIYLMIVADTGNISSAYGPSSTYLSQTGLLTGVNFFWEGRYTFYDN
jgi:hypothetical protein